MPPDLLWLAFGYCVISLAAIRTTPTGILRLHFRYASATAAEAVQPVIRALGAGLAFVLMPTVTGFIIAYAVAEVAVTIALWLVAARVQPMSLRAVSLKAIPARHKDAWRFVVSTNLSGSLSIAGKQVMILLVGTFGGAALAGGFRVASQLGQALVSLAQTVSKAILPELVHARENALEIARRMANIAAVGGVIAVVTALVFGRMGLELIAGEEFGLFYWAMVILAIAGAVELVGASLDRCWSRPERRTSPSSCVPCRRCWHWCCSMRRSTGTGAKGAAFAMLGSSSLAVIGFYVAILNLSQIRLVVEPEEESGTDTKPVPPANL